MTREFYISFLKLKYSVQSWERAGWKSRLCIVILGKGLNRRHILVPENWYMRSLRDYHERRK